MIINNVSKVQAINSILTNNRANVVNVDCNNVHWVNNSAAGAFAYFPNLTTVTNIGNTVTDIGGMFYHCPNLVNAPTIPNSVNVITRMVDHQMYYGYQLAESITYYGMTISALYLTSTDLPQTLVYTYEDSGWGAYFMDLPVATATAGSNNTVTFTIGDPDFEEVVTGTGTRDSSLDQEGELFPERYESAFGYCTSLVNAPVLGNGVTDISSIYTGCSSLVNVPSLPNSVTDISSSFCNCFNLVDAPEIPNSVTRMANTFYNCVNLVNVPTFSENTISMADAFSGCYNLVNIPANIPSTVTNMSYTFYNCKNLVNVPNIPASVTDFYGTFSCCSNLNPQENYSLAHLSGSAYYGYMFSSCLNLVNAPILPATVNDNGRNFTGMFHACLQMVHPPVLPSGLVGMNKMFQSCQHMTEAPVIPNTVTDMSYAFEHCFSLTTPPTIPNSVTTMYSAFLGCYGLTQLPEIPNSVTNLAYTFYNCAVNQAPEIPNSVTNMYATFTNCQNLTGTIIIQSSNITNAVSCFNQTTAVKNVYIPLKYANNANTATYNAFINAGYTTDGAVNGVYICDINTVPTPNSIDATGYTYTIDNGVVTLTDAPVDANGEVLFPNIEE